jgi:hypothetical protein
VLDEAGGRSCWLRSCRQIAWDAVRQVRCWRLLARSYVSGPTRYILQ